MQNESQTILDRVLNGLGYKKPSRMDFATMKTADGQNTFESEGFMPTDAVFIVSEDGNIKVPAGTYEMEDGSKISVDDAGVITEMISPDQIEEMQNAPMKEATGKPVAQEQTNNPKTIIETMTKETQFAEITPSVEDKKEEQTMSKPALLIKCEDMVGGGELAEKVAEAIVSIVDSPEGEEIIAEYKKMKSGTKMSSHSKDDNAILDAINKLQVQLSAIKTENDKLRDELSKEGNRTHFNPDASTSTKMQFKLGAKREETIEDRVFQQLFN